MFGGVFGGAFGDVLEVFWDGFSGVSINENYTKQNLTHPCWKTFRSPSKAFKSPVKTFKSLEKCMFSSVHRYSSAFLHCSTPLWRVRTGRLPELTSARACVQLCTHDRPEVGISICMYVHIHLYTPTAQKRRGFHRGISKNIRVFTRYF